jgi:hypothetical protein
MVNRKGQEIKLAFSGGGERGNFLLFYKTKIGLFGS